MGSNPTFGTIWVSCSKYAHKSEAVEASFLLYWHTLAPTSPTKKNRGLGRLRSCRVVLVGTHLSCYGLACIREAQRSIEYICCVVPHSLCDGGLQQVSSLALQRHRDVAVKIKGYHHIGMA